MGGAVTGLLRVRRGRSPNCSAVGSVVGLAIASAVIGAALLNAWAARLRGEGPGADGSRNGGDGGNSGGSDGGNSGGSDGDNSGGSGGDNSGGSGGGDIRSGSEAVPSGEADGTDTSALRLRREAFGGILAWPAPPALLHLDHASTEAAVRRGARPMGSTRDVPGALRAPTELHVAVTDRCPVRCDGCYLDAGPDRAPPEPALDDLRRTLDDASALGVFEIAFGGGEAGLRSDLLDLARHARSLGLVPNLTTSGFGVTEALAHRMAPLFGQVNVSLDGLGASYVAMRGWDGTALATTAIDRLVKAGAAVGVNTVVSRRNFDDLDLIGAELASRGVQEWQWLRFKPAGRGAANYGDHALAPGQSSRLFPLALVLEERHGLTIRWDCAMVPFLAEHGVDPDLLVQLGVDGCVGGHSLAVRKTDGRFSACSFAPDQPAAGPLPQAWRSPDSFARWRAPATAEPCASCAWAPSCRGGCRAVSAWYGDPFAPDPECAAVRAHRPNSTRLPVLVAR